MDKTISGDEFTEIIHTEILKHKANIVADKINDYFETINQNNIDIPEFMKPKELQTAFFIEKSINRMIENGTLDHFYKLAIQEE